MSHNHAQLSVIAVLLLVVVVSTALPVQHEEEEDGSGRYIGLTKGGKWFGAVQIEVPLTVVLPTLGFRTRYSRSHTAARSLTGGSTLSRPNYDPTDPDYHMDYYYGPLLSRLDAYFHYLGLHDEHCRRKLVCQLSKQPAKFSPLSDVINKALKESESYERPEMYNPAVFRYFRYFWAARRSGSCNDIYQECPEDAEDMVNLSVLRAWQEIAGLLAIKLVDE